MTRIAFSIPGEPKGKDRARHVPSLIWVDGEPKAIVRVVTPRETVMAERLIAQLFRAKFPRHVPWTGAVLIRFTAVFATPKSFNRKLQEAARAGTLHCIKKPDKDNIEKLVADALKGLAWHDDCQVMGGGVKRYGTSPRVDVTLELMDTGDAPATPGEKRTIARAIAEANGTARPALRANQTKPKTGHLPAPLRKRVEAALERDARPAPVQRALFGDES